MAKFTLEEIEAIAAGKLDQQIVTFPEGDPLPPMLAGTYGPIALVDLDVTVFTINSKFVMAVPKIVWYPFPDPTPSPVPAAPAQVLPFHKGPVEVRPRSVWPGTYNEYLATPEWRQIAADARKEWKYQCLMNVDHHGPVEMHHRSYQNVPFKEDWRDLIPLCEECHAKYHGRLAKPDRGLFDEPEQIKRAA